MKDFDEARKERAERDRSFKIGGETFVMKTGVRPEVLASYEEIDTDKPALEVIGLVDEVILGMMENGDGSHERYRDLRARENDPLSLEDLRDVVQWLIEEQTGRVPTQPLSPSGPGPERTRTRSTGGSSSKAAKTASKA